ncbi:hypothetical protein Q3G72_030290 [Acer saccharum]|nr:hypothetical protein Q3G72_030290 [Acer saccharum]
MNTTTTFRHPHSPKSTTPTNASAAIMDRAVSSRRSAAPYSSDAEPLTCASPIRVAEAAAVDESKTKRQQLSLLASNYLSRIANSPCLVLCIVTALVVISLTFHSRSLVCVSPYDPVSRIGPGLLRPDALESDFGRLKQALKAGFRNLVFEDNYDTGTGDHYSLRQICDQFYIRGGGHNCFRDSDEARVRAMWTG